jgi:hypothetical protein
MIIFWQEEEDCMIHWKILSFDEIWNKSILFFEKASIS